MPNDLSPLHDHHLTAPVGKSDLESQETPPRALDTSAGHQHAPLPRNATGATNGNRAKPDTMAAAHRAARLGTPLHDRDTRLIIGNGGETVPAEASLHAYQPIVQQPPELLAAQATEVRLKQAAAISHEAMVLAVEATQSNAASGAMERDIIHQFAVLQSLGMDLLAASKRFLVTTTPWQSEERQQLQSIEATRCAVAGAKVLGASQQAARTLKYLRDGGRQVVTVQHVTVEAGGQAVVAGTVKRRRRGR